MTQIENRSNKPRKPTPKGRLQLLNEVYQSSIDATIARVLGDPVTISSTDTTLSTEWHGTHVIEPIANKITESEQRVYGQRRKVINTHLAPGEGDESFPVVFEDNSGLLSDAGLVVEDALTGTMLEPIGNYVGRRLVDEAEDFTKVSSIVRISVRNAEFLLDKAKPRGAGGLLGKRERRGVGIAEYKQMGEDRFGYTERLLTVRHADLGQPIPVSYMVDAGNGNTGIIHQEILDSHVEKGGSYVYKREDGELVVTDSEGNQQTYTVRATEDIRLTTDVESEPVVSVSIQPLYGREAKTDNQKIAEKKVSLAKAAFTTVRPGGNIPIRHQKQTATERGDEYHLVLRTSGGIVMDVELEKAELLTVHLPRVDSNNLILSGELNDLSDPVPTYITKSPISLIRDEGPTEVARQLDKVARDTAPGVITAVMDSVGHRGTILSGELTTAIRQEFDAIAPLEISRLEDGTIPEKVAFETRMFLLKTPDLTESSGDRITKIDALALEQRLKTDQRLAELKGTIEVAERAKGGSLSDEEIQQLATASVGGAIVFGGKNEKTAELGEEERLIIVNRAQGDRAIRMAKNT